MAGNGRVIVSCTHGEEDPDHVVVSYLTAGAALDQGKQVVMWLSAEGVRLALRGYVDRIRAGQEPPVERVHAQFIDKGGRFYVCPICFNERDLAQADLVDPRRAAGCHPTDGARTRRGDDVQLLRTADRGLRLEAKEILVSAIRGTTAAAAATSPARCESVPHAV
jgi:uncharacterized protein